jgi:uncharacterized protein (TIGR03437 family)
LHLTRLTFLFACAWGAAGADYTTYIGDAFPYTVKAITTDAKGNTYATGSRTVTANLTDVFVSKIDPLGNVTLIATFSGKGSDQGNGIAVDAAGNIYVAGYTSSADFPLLHPSQSTASSLGTGFLVKLAADGTVLYSTYLGGAASESYLTAVAADAQGNAYVTGETFASDYPHTSGLPAPGVAGPAAPGGYSAAFFAKISSAGDKILYAGGLAGDGHACGAGSSCFLSVINNSGVAIAVDPAGNAYIAGNTYGVGLPTTAGALATEGIGGFVARVNASGTALDYVTLLGAANDIIGGAFPNSAPATLVHAIAADAAGNAYLSGSTNDPDFPTTPGAFQSTLPQPNPQYFPPASGFAAKLNPTGTAMAWATFLGGTSGSDASTIAVDAAGDVWVSGTTGSPDFPGSSGFPGGKEFLAELNPSGSALGYGARFPSDTVAQALAVDPGGVVHFSGDTGIVSTLTPGQSAEARLLGVENAAEDSLVTPGLLAGRVAPGEVISIYGVHFGVATPVSAALSGSLPMALAGVQVTIGGTPLPLLYVSDTQINCITPFELTSGTAVSLAITVNQQALPAFRLVVDLAIPAVFGGVLNQDGTINSQSNPAQPDSIVTVWATGVGAIYGLADGQIATAAQNFECCQVQGSANTVYAGAAPDLPNGIVQINFQVAANAGNTYSLDVNNRFSLPFGVWVGQ